MDTYFGESAVSADNNIEPVGSVYPGTGPTLANMGNPNSAAAMVYASNGSGPSLVATTPDTSAGGHPLTWWAGIAVIVVLIFYFGKRTGNEGEFSNLRASTYNITLITLIAILGLTVTKILAVKVANVRGLGGLSSIVIAA